MGGSQGLQSRAAGTSLQLLHVFLDSFNKHGSGLCARYSSAHFTNITLVNPHTRLLTRQYREPHFQGRRLSPERLSNLPKALQPVGGEPWVQSRQPAPEPVVSPLCLAASSPGNLSILIPHWLWSSEPQQTSGKGLTSAAEGVAGSHTLLELLPCSCKASHLKAFADTVSAAQSMFSLPLCLVNPSSTAALLDSKI